MTFDHAQYQSDRIHDLTQRLAGARLLREELILQLAWTIQAYEARLWVYGLSQDAFMRELEQAAA